MFNLAFGSVLINEVKNYYAYRILEGNVQRKRYFENTNDTKNVIITPRWFENYIVNNSTVDELKGWIRHTFSYNQSTDAKYYVPIELEQIPRDKMLKWVSYYMYYKSMWQLTKEQLEYSAVVLNKIEYKLKINFSDIEDKSIYFLKFGNNKIQSDYRPKFMSSCLSIIKDVCYFTLNMFGFKSAKLSEFGFSYYHYYNSDKHSNVLFIHGFGFGITPYMTYLLELKKKVNLYVIVIPNISNMEYSNYNIHTHDPKTILPDYELWRSDIKSMIVKHNISSLDCIAHSFGTIIFGILLNDKWIYNKINKKIFIEPVCFIEKSYKIFRYINEPYNTNDMITILFNELIYKDIYLKYTTQRFLYGPEFWQVDYNKLNNNSMVILSEKDQVVPTDELHEKLSDNNIKCIYVKEAKHADLFMSDKYNGVFEVIDDFILNF